MQHDEAIWQVIRHNHCSFMAKTETANFCRNPYNVTGECNRSSCPLANSRYATIRDHDGVFYLYMKTVERAHMPNKLWQRVKLPRNYEKALEIIDKHLMYWPKLLVHKTKQRLTKLTQMRIRMRKLVLKPREKLITVPTKEKKREARREEKAEKAARLDKSIEEELIKRLENNVYPSEIWRDLIDKEGEKATISEDEEEEMLQEPEIGEFEGELEQEEEEEDIEDMCSLQKFYADDEEENVSISARKLEKEESAFESKKKAKVQVEVEHEGGIGRQRALYYVPLSTQIHNLSL